MFGVCQAARHAYHWMIAGMQVYQLGAGNSYQHKCNSILSLQPSQAFERKWQLNLNLEV